jgi:hypothetical protein
MMAKRGSHSHRQAGPVAKSARLTVQKSPTRPGYQSSLTHVALSGPFRAGDVARPPGCGFGKIANRGRLRESDYDVFSRDSPDDSLSGVNIHVFPALLQDSGEVRTPLTPYSDFADTLRLTAIVIEWLTDARTGRNGRHAFVGLLPRSVFGRLAG